MSELKEAYHQEILHKQEIQEKIEQEKQKWQELLIKIDGFKNGGWSRQGTIDINVLKDIIKSLMEGK